MNAKGEVVCGPHGTPWCSKCSAEIEKQFKQLDRGQLNRARVALTVAHRKKNKRHPNHQRGMAGALRSIKR